MDLNLWLPISIKMPNTCVNVITLKATQAQIETILTCEFTDVPRWAFQIIRIGKESIMFKIWSPWTPNKDLINRLVMNYPGLWLKNEWNEEGGNAGVIVGNAEHLKDLEWNEGCIEEWADRWSSPNTSLVPVLKDE